MIKVKFLDRALMTVSLYSRCVLLVERNKGNRY